ncbi:MAG: LysR family transcriptional regulator [Streptomycetales bacterium]
MRRVDHIDWLETFVAVVDHGGFSAAADAVHRSQSRVSAHVASLEHALGACLFDRRHRPVALTDAGEAFLSHARAVLTQLDLGQSDVDGVLGLTRGHVVLGSYPSASAAFVPTVLRSFRRHCPDVRVDLVEQPTLDLAGSLAAGEVQLALRPRIPHPRAAGIRSRSLWREWLVAVVPRDHPLAAAPEPVQLPLIAGYPVITIGRPRPDAPVMYEAHEAFRRAGLEPHIAWQTDQPQTLASLVRAELGVGVTNELAAEVSETSALVVRRLADLGQGREVAVFWDDRRHQSVAARALLREIVATSVPAGTVPPARGGG